MRFLEERTSSLPLHGRKTKEGVAIPTYLPHMTTSCCMRKTGISGGSREICSREQKIKNLDIDGVVSIELEYSPDPARIVEWVEEAYAATDKLMRAVGLRG